MKTQALRKLAFAVLCLILVLGICSSSMSSAGVSKDGGAYTINADYQPGKPFDYNGLAVYSPVDCQVFQRQTRLSGRVLISGRSEIESEKIEYRLTGKSLKGTLPGKWMALSVNPVDHSFNNRVPAPAGGWYKLEIRVIANKKVAATRTIDRVGVGEVFVTAGQSNSTNCGQFPSKQTSGMVSCFSGNDWQVRDDPFIGTHDGSVGGSAWPAFGDAMYAKYNVPIGIAATGHGGTSVEQWNTDGELFNWMMTRIRELGPGGFRAVLWHQGEADAVQESDWYFTRMAKLIRDSNRIAGWYFPWITAQASYWDAEKPSFESVRSAQKRIWDAGLAFPGPDTDTLCGDNRDYDGKGIHFGPKGLKAHGEMWAAQVGKYLDRVLD